MGFPDRSAFPSPGEGKMNILFYTRDSTYVHRRIGGAQTSIRLMAESLAARGHQVSYFTNGEDDSTSFSVQSINGVEVILCPKTGMRDWRYRFAELFGGRVFALKEAVRRRMRAHIRDRRIDCVYMYYELPAFDIWRAVGPRHDVPLILRMAGLAWYEYAKKDRKKRSKFMRFFAGADSIHYNTAGLVQLVRERAAEMGFHYRPKHEFVGDIGAQVDRGVEAPALWAGDGPLKILIATRFSFYQKRHDLVIHALASLEDRSRVAMTLIGGGPKEREIREKISMHGLADLVTIKPFCSQEDLWSEMQNHHLLCHPCEYEGLSKIIVESMLIGLPVMASNVKPIPDYLEDGKNAILVDNDVASWANAIARVAREPGVLEPLREQAREDARVRFDPEINIIQLESYFKDVIERSG